MRIFESLAITASLVVASPAHAALYTATYTGTVASITDQTGIFGGATAGSPFSMVFTLDTSAFASVADEYPGLFDYRSFQPSGLVKGALYVNGGSIEVGGTGDFQAFLISDGATNPYGGQSDYIDVYTEDFINSVSSKSLSATFYPLNQDTITAPVTAGGFDYTLKPGDQGSGTFSYVHNTWDDGPLVNTYGDLAISRVVVAAVPELETWAMMVASIGVVGGVLRRRRMSQRIVCPV